METAVPLSEVKPLDNLIPALIQCFGVILLGYLAGRWRIMSDTQAQGLNSYVTTFALPAVFFRVMVSIDFSGVCWYFVIAVSLGKAAAFVSVLLITLLLSRRLQLGPAAILSMFVSQSNDVALGYPVLLALYPDLASYVYLFAPAQLIALNPFAYFLLEWHQSFKSTDNLKRLDDKDHTHPQPSGSFPEAVDQPSGSGSSPPMANGASLHLARFKRVLKVLLRVLLNPIFFMTVIGVVFNFILTHKLPIYIDGLLKIIADSFSATALFTLGFGMVGKMNRINRREIFILIAILLIKLIILPFVNRELVVRFLEGHTTANETVRYSTFAFLYGAIPTAPPVYLFASLYEIMPVVIGVGLVLGTVLCAPMMVILSQIVTMYKAKPSEYDQLLINTVYSVSWISVICCLCTLIVLFLSRKAFRIPHRFLIGYLFCVLLSCLGVAAGCLLSQSDEYALERALNKEELLSQPASGLHYLQFCVFFIGCTGARLWTFLLALILFLQRFRGFEFLLRHQLQLYLAGFATPVLVTSILLLTSTRQRVKDIDPTFQYGQAQLFVSLTILLLCTLGTFVFIIWYIRLGSGDGHYYEVLSQSSSVESQSPVAISSFAATCSWTIQLSIHADEGDRGNIEGDASGCDDDDTIVQNSLLHRRQGQYIPSSSLSPANQSTSSSLLNDPLSASDQPLQSDLTHLEQHWNVNSATESTVSKRSSLNRHGQRVLHGTQSPQQDLEFQHERHLLLLLLLLTTMFFGICLCVWRLVEETPSGIYIVLEFLDGTLNFGQGVLLFVLFGLDIDLIVMPVIRFAKRHFLKFCGPVIQGNVLESPLNTVDNSDWVHRFVTYHKASCDLLVEDIKIGSTIYRDVFKEQSLVKWIHQAGIATKSADECVRMLESAGVISSVPIDKQLLYRGGNSKQSKTKDIPRLLRFTQ